MELVHFMKYENFMTRSKMNQIKVDMNMNDILGVHYQVHLSFYNTRLHREKSVAHSCYMYIEHTVQQHS